LADKEKPVLGAVREVRLIMADGSEISTENRLPVTLETEITSIPVGDVWVGIEEGTQL
jgi:hypothetical protein